MESHVLMPEALSLSVQRPSSMQGLCSPMPMSVARMLEQTVTVVAARKVVKGTRFAPASGTVRIGKLDVYSTLQDNDVRCVHGGGYDEVVDEARLTGRRYRRCNWVRFLNGGNDGDSDNIRCFREVSSGNIVFEATEDIEAGAELVASYDTSSSSSEVANPPLLLGDIILNASNAVLTKVVANILADSPLDLSRRLLISSSSDQRKPPSFSLTPVDHRLDVNAAVISPASTVASFSTDSGISSSSEDSHHGNIILRPLPLLPPSASTSSALPTPDLPSTGNQPLQFEVAESVTSTVSSAASPTMAASDKNNNSRASSRNSNSSSSPKKTAKKMLPCDFCGKCFDRPSLLNRHTRTHTGERPHVCDVCNKGFSTSSSLNTHRRIHSGEKPHECGVCGKRFTASSNLYYHRMTHVKEKPHKCEICQKSFPTPGDLKSHMYVHNGSWPHRCHICDRGFSKITNLRNHLFLHTGEKPHQCGKCLKRFALGCNMKAHMKTHEEEEEEAAEAQKSHVDVA